MNNTTKDISKEFTEFTKAQFGKFDQALLMETFQEALLNITKGHEDAPELVAVFRSIDLEHLEKLVKLLDMVEVCFFAGKRGKYKAVVEVSGYISAEMGNELQKVRPAQPAKTQIDCGLPNCS